MEKLLVYLVCKYQGDYRKVTQAIQKGETYSHILIDECIQGLDCCYTTILSDNYPLALRDLKDPPYVLFYLGDLTLASKPCISMVGMREPSPYGQVMAARFAKKLSENFVIVSGLAKGIDGISHRNARQTIAVLGCGIDICYPKSHQQLYSQIAMITVGHALALGKNVFALPCRITDYDGTLTLIQDGATPVISVEDIYESLNL